MCAFVGTFPFLQKALLSSWTRVQPEPAVVLRLPPLLCVRSEDMTASKFRGKCQSIKSLITIHYITQKARKNGSSELWKEVTTLL
jgi:hypothetical protein